MGRGVGRERRGLGSGSELRGGGSRRVFVLIYPVAYPFSGSRAARRWGGGGDGEPRLASVGSWVRGEGLRRIELFLRALGCFLRVAALFWIPCKDMSAMAAASRFGWSNFTQVRRRSAGRISLPEFVAELDLNGESTLFCCQFVSPGGLLDPTVPFPTAFCSSATPSSANTAAASHAQSLRVFAVRLEACAPAPSGYSLF